MNLFYAGEYLFENKTDVGVYTNRLLSYDYQNKYVKVLIEEKEKFSLFLAGLDKFGKDEVSKYMELYLASPEDEQGLKLSANVLFSYLLQQNKVDNFKNTYQIGKLFVDSGAFSAWTKGVKIDVDKYVEWLNDRPQIDLFGQVDVIPGDRVCGATKQQVKKAAKETWENYLYMRDRVNNKNGLLYTFHVGEPLEYLENALEWVDENNKHIPYIALGGMVGKPKKVRDTFLQNCFDIIYKSSNPTVNVHAFGMTDFDLLEKYPIHSADSTSWIMVGAMGNIMSDFGTITVSENKQGESTHWKRLSDSQIKEFEKKIERFGFTLQELSISRDKRIMLNAMYMMEKAKKIKQVEYKPKNRRLF